MHPPSRPTAPYHDPSRAIWRGTFTWKYRTTALLERSGPVPNVSISRQPPTSERHGREASEPCRDSHADLHRELRLGTPVRGARWRSRRSLAEASCLAAALQERLPWRVQLPRSHPGGGASASHEARALPPPGPDAPPPPPTRHHQQTPPPARRKGEGVGWVWGWWSCPPRCRR